VRKEEISSSDSSSFVRNRRRAMGDLLRVYTRQPDARRFEPYLTNL